MIRHLSLLALFIKNSLQVELEYRFNFIGLLAMSLMDATWSVGGALLFYSRRHEIGGWTFHEALVVIGLYFLAVGFVDIAISPNIDAIVEHIRTGSMDYVLTKPIIPQVYATLRKYRFQKITGLLVGMIILLYGLIRVGATPGIGQSLLFVFMCAGGLVLLYAAMTLLGTLSFWLVDVTSIDEFVVGFLEAGRYPSDIFPEPVRGLITFVVPIAFITTVPAEVLLGRLTPQFVLYGWVIAIILLVASVALWQVALRHYSSASS